MVEKMENQTKDVYESENFSEAFLCCVCLDLLYKPIVLSCGHISCFWCIHDSMNGLSDSHCPICRHPYNHFPTVCQMLHAVLMKMYPVAYKRRENQTLEEEKKRKIFSPQFDILACGLSPIRELNNPFNPADSRTTFHQPNLCSITSESDSSSLFQNYDTNQNCNETNEMNKAVCSKEEKLLLNNLHGNQKKISLGDVLCVACNQMLFQPVVFNCGHVYCKTCIIIPTEEKLTCQVCQTVHPNGSPKVCLELDRFLEQEFPEEYSLKKACFQRESPTSCSTESSKIATSLPIRENTAWWSDHGSNVHIGAGCDFCGMFPIVGDRYRCKDCVEKIGFDLCGDCYNTRSKRPGRFNQQHTSEHQFKLVRSPSMLRNIMLRLVNNDNASAASTLSEINLAIAGSNDTENDDDDDDDTPPPVI